jgi:hypothetical protein
MYYLFNATWLAVACPDWYARLETKIEGPLNTWNGKSPPPHLPSLTFSVPEKAVMLDNFVTGTSVELYSDKLVSILQQYDLHFDIKEAEILVRETMERSTHQYYVFRLLDTFNALDKEKSNMSPKKRRYVASKELLDSKKLMVRDSWFLSKVVVHAQLKEHLERENISGCEYIPIIC